jgi:hypothetical protein
VASPSLQAARRRFGFAVVLSVVIHALIFSLPSRKPRTPAMGGAPAPFQVTLEEAPAPVAEAAPPPSAPAPAPSVVTPPPRPRVLASREPAKKPAPPPEPVAEPPPPPAPPQPPPPQFDMAAMIASRQAQRRAADAAAARGPKATPEPSPADSALASINRNLQSLGPEEGVGGLFQILRKGSLTGEFSFDGYQPERNRRWREVIEVRAGPDGDVETAMIRRMIELIRTHYSGDFNFRSQRIGRIVVLSARPEDQAELERFLRNELFGMPVLNPTK